MTAEQLDQKTKQKSKENVQTSLNRNPFKNYFFNSNGSHKAMQFIQLIKMKKRRKKTKKLLKKYLRYAITEEKIKIKTTEHL